MLAPEDDSILQELTGAGDNLISDFGSYEDYLDSQISPTDLYYLEDEVRARTRPPRRFPRAARRASVPTPRRGPRRRPRPQDLARQLVELGYRGSGETLKREEFEARKRAVEEARLAKLHAAPKPLASAGKDLSALPLLAALAEREELVRNGKLTTIIFLRDRNAKGQEISGCARRGPGQPPRRLAAGPRRAQPRLTGACSRAARRPPCRRYIDFGHRLKTEEMEPYFGGKKRLLPRPSDLSFYNWETQSSASHHTPNFQVIADSEAGLLFKNKRDRKVLNVDPKAPPGDNSRRVELGGCEYVQAVLYDHVTRRKT